MLDIEGTNEDIVLNSNTESEKEKSAETLNNVLWHVDAGDEPTIVNIGGYYITSRRNAADYTEMYGWIFSKILVAEM